MFGNGIVLDLKFHPAFFENDKHRVAFKYLVETYFELGSMEVQFNVVSRETLIKHEEHKTEMYIAEKRQVEKTKLKAKSREAKNRWAMMKPVNSGLFTEFSSPIYR